MIYTTKSTCTTVIVNIPACRFPPAGSLSAGRLQAVAAVSTSGRPFSSPWPEPQSGTCLGRRSLSSGCRVSPSTRGRPAFRSPTGAGWPARLPDRRCAVGSESAAVPRSCASACSGRSPEAPVSVCFRRIPLPSVLLSFALLCFALLCFVSDCLHFRPDCIRMEVLPMHCVSLRVRCRFLLPFPPWFWTAPARRVGRPAPFTFAW